MSEKPTAREIGQRLTKLEADLAAKKNAIAKAQAALNSCYATGASPEKALEEVARLKAEAAAMIAALSGLDKLFYEAATEEHEAARARLRAEAEAGYKETEAALVAAVGEHIEPLLKKFSISSEHLAAFLEAAKADLWGAFCDRVGEEIMALGPKPHLPMPRDENGKPMTVDFYGRITKASA
jgi:NADH dehydrogenase/NADH:ubiquinone oxidoreductase subunit G